MKLYLSSYRIPTPDDLAQLIGKQPRDTKMAIIPNAKDYYAKRAWDFKTNEAVTYMRERGFQPEVVDLRDYDQPERIAIKLKEYDLVWVNGGNTLCLRYEMRRSGFDQIIKGLVDNGLVYGGESAGAMIAGTTLKGVEFADQPEFAENIIYEGLNIIPNVILTHADSLAFGDGIIKMIELHKDDPTAVILNDNQAFLVDGGQTKIVTAPPSA